MNNSWVSYKIAANSILQKMSLPTTAHLDGSFGWFEPSIRETAMRRTSRTSVSVKISQATATAISLAALTLAPLPAWLGLLPASSATTQPFVVNPYIQLGNNPTYGPKVDNLALLWISKDDSAKWSVDVKRAGQDGWKKTASIIHREIKKDSDGKDFVFECALKDLPVNKAFDYRVLKDDVTVFESSAHARKSKDQPYKFEVFGDMGADSYGQRKIGNLSFQSKPDFIVFPGDLVYPSGLYGQYLTSYFPIYNANKLDSNYGVPLLRSVLTVGLVGNHDIASSGRLVPADLDRNAEALAYFYLWSEPLNGPAQYKKSVKGTPPLVGSVEKIDTFKRATGEHFPGMCNFSFDYGNSHWLVLDGNYYTDWTDPAARKWVEDDLRNATKSTWKFVTFHQPGFSMDSQHSKEQRMRLLSDIFQREKVDIVFSGHAHDYQRTFPLTFEPRVKDGVPAINEDGTVDGTTVLDKDFDGAKVTKAKGVIYIVTGAGGARLYRARSGDDRVKLDFIDKFNSAHYSLTSCEVNDRKLDIKQIADDGTVIDQFALAK